ncbi:hypothetical protein K438DRAFT_1971894 [Mycena galopus ATCC 62051]|nr:hypothetical protein K438DRAFT_1971894 [Mycena galopus ATCC 62051]
MVAAAAARVQRRSCSPIRGVPTYTPVTPNQHPDTIGQNIRRVLPSVPATGLEDSQESNAHEVTNASPALLPPRELMPRKAHDEHHSGGSMARTAAIVLHNLIASSKPFAKADGNAIGSLKMDKHAKVREEEKVQLPPRLLPSQENGVARASMTRASEASDLSIVQRRGGDSAVGSKRPRTQYEGGGDGRVPAPAAKPLKRRREKPQNGRDL